MGNHGNAFMSFGGGGTVGGWKELGRSTLGSTADTMTISSLPDKRYYVILCHSLDTVGATQPTLRFNGDTGSNYASRWSNDGAADSIGTGRTNLVVSDNGIDTSSHLTTAFVSNYATKEKLVISQTNLDYTNGAGTAPRRMEAVGKWANTSDAISSITIFNQQAAGDFNTGSECVVLGWDPADTHTDNFWTELDSITLGSSNNSITSNTFTAKKYLWVQVYVAGRSGSTDSTLRFNGDSAGNYAYRRSIDGGADGTSASAQLDNFDVGGSSVATPSFSNMFIINTSANEKLIIGHAVNQGTAGATTAPNRKEFVGKWVNTSSQITSLVFNNASSTYSAGTTLKIWGAD